MLHLQKRNISSNNKMPLISSEIILMQTCSPKCFIANSNGIAIFGITGAKPYIPKEELSTQGNIKLLQQIG